MQDTTASSGLSTYSGRQIHAEYVTSSSALVGKQIDTIVIQLRKVGSPTGTVQIGIFNADQSVKKSFGAIDPSILTTAYKDYTFSLSASDQPYLIQSGDRIGIKYTGGDASTNYIAIMTDQNDTDPFDGTNSFHTYYDTTWKTLTTKDLYMTLKLSDRIPPVITLLGSNPMPSTQSNVTNNLQIASNVNDNSNGKGSSNIEGTIIIKTLSASLVAGATYTVSPNPQTGSGSLTITDGGAGDEDGLANGIIKISHVLKGKYAIKQVNIPSGFFSLLRSSGKTINPSHLNKTVTFPVVPKNMDLTQLPPKPLPSPSLSDDAFNRWVSSVSARIVNDTNSGIIINNADQMPQVILAGSRNTSAISESVSTVSSVLLNASFAPLTSGSTIVNTIGLGNYSLPNTANVVTVIPTIVTNVSTTNGYIASTPIVSGVIPGQEMIIPVADPLIPSFGGLKAITVQPSSKSDGVNNTNWFVAEVENKIPPTISSKGIKNTPILFISIQHPFEENKTGFNWSNASNLAVPPTLTIIVHKNSSSSIQQDSVGCPVVNTYTLASGSWTTLGVGELSSKSVSRSKCQIIISSQHLSKFAFSLMHLDSLVMDTSSAFGKVVAVPQVMTLTLNPITPVPWGANIIVSGKLSATSSGVGLGGKTITFTGTGAAGLSSIITKSDGTFSVSGQSPNMVSTGWKINANFAGDSSYVASSATQSYNTLVHSASLILVISPSSVVKSSTYSITGTLTDTTTGKPLNAMIISSSGTSITISKTTTTSTGTYLVGGLKAPISIGTYFVRAQFDGTTLYSPANSLVKTLTVTTAPSIIQAKK